MQRHYPKFSRVAHELMQWISGIHESTGKIFRMRGEEVGDGEDRSGMDLRGGEGDAGLTEEADEDIDGGVIVEDDSRPGPSRTQAKSARTVRFAEDILEPETAPAPNPSRSTQTPTPTVQVQADLSRLNLDFNNQRHDYSNTPPPFLPGGRPKEDTPESRRLRRTTRVQTEIDAASHMATCGTVMDRAPQQISRRTPQPVSTRTQQPTTRCGFSNTPATAVSRVYPTNQPKKPDTETGFRNSLDESIAYYRIRRNNFEMEIKQPASAPPPVVQLDTGVQGGHETLVRGVGVHVAVGEAGRDRRGNDGRGQDDLMGRRLRLGLAGLDGGVGCEVGRGTVQGWDERGRVCEIPCRDVASRSRVALRLPTAPATTLAPRMPAAPRRPRGLYMSQEMGMGMRMGMRRMSQEMRMSMGGRGKSPERTEAGRERWKGRGKVQRTEIREA
jgi:hypothetical protein